MSEFDLPQICRLLPPYIGRKNSKNCTQKKRAWCDLFPITSYTFTNSCEICSTNTTKTFWQTKTSPASPANGQCCSWQWNQIIIKWSVNLWLTDYVNRQKSDDKMASSSKIFSFFRRWICILIDLLWMKFGLTVKRLQRD